MCEHVFVRWENLTTEQDEQARLPGYTHPAVVRHFDAPEALDMRFYEVQARSALNRVPERSRMPFRWTINPYRGCSHACVYCAAGDTPILMADGRTKALQDLVVGDRIIGTERVGWYRRYVETDVRAHWSSVKPAHRVTLEDGTELVTSGDHRFLSDRGWKHVTGSEQGAGRRPHLTTANKLIGTGRFARQPEQSVDYRRGYLCGVTRGDGTLGTSTFERGEAHRFRLALVDREALERAQRFLETEGVGATAYRFAAAGGARREVTAIRTQAEARVDRVRELVAWPLSPSDDWRKGFLAGIFDAEGSAGREALRIANCDRTLLAWTRASLEHLGFDVTEEVTGKANGLRYVRIRGGLRERLRFFHTCDPAATRKRAVQGIALKSDAKTRVASIEPLGLAMRLYDITTGTGDFIANGVVSHNCFARPTHTYLDLDAGRDFEREIVVKVNAPEVLRRELARPSWKGEHVAMGTNTDPYQWVEGRYKLMRGIWEALRDARNPCSILTKSPLVLRDLDLLREISEVTEISASFSVPTLDEGAWRETEPHTPSPRARLDAVAKLNAAGIPTGILVAPLMPGINDDPAQVDEILRAAEEAGATSVGGIGLHLRGEVRDVFMGWLREARPDLVPRYEELYARGAYAPKAERERLAGLIRRGRFRGRDPGFVLRARNDAAPRRPESARAEVAAEQPSLPLDEAGPDGSASHAPPRRRRPAPSPVAKQGSLF
jgi:DNA repair photolyase